MSMPKFVVVVGTSAGGLNALAEFVSQLRLEMDAAVFVVMHLSRTGMGEFLIQRLQPLTDLKCSKAMDGTLIEKGQLYFAAPNSHLLIKNNGILLGYGPEENRWRPSIDVLFRSAAAAFSTRAIGVILTGMLDDGTQGMLAIKRSGGTCIVQDPNEAEYPDMPLSVLNTIEANYCIPLAEMGNVLYGITQTEPEDKPAPRDIILESEIAERVVVDYEHVKKLGEKSIYACPDCGGGLWHMNSPADAAGKVDRYRCHIGHSYSEQDLVIKQAASAESTLWIALRMMEERRNLLKKMETDHFKRGLATMAKNYCEKANGIQAHVEKLKEILFEAQRQI